jgi:hypothetical protein
MPTQSGTSNNQATTTGNGPLGILVGLLFGSFGVIWLGAQLAALLGSKHRAARVNFFDALPAVGKLVTAPKSPGLAWKSDPGAFPGPGLYWASTVGTFVLFVAFVVLLWRLVARLPVGSAERRVLGVDPKARLATVRDLAPIHIREAATGRFLLGESHGRLVATELRRTHMPPEDWMTRDASVPVRHARLTVGIPAPLIPLSPSTLGEEES